MASPNMSRTRTCRCAVRRAERSGRLGTQLGRTPEGARESAPGRRNCRVPPSAIRLKEPLWEPTLRRVPVAGILSRSAPCDAYTHSRPFVRPRSGRRPGPPRSPQRPSVSTRPERRVETARRSMRGAPPSARVVRLACGVSRSTKSARGPRDVGASFRSPSPSVRRRPARVHSIRTDPDRGPSKRSLP